ncbi:MAG: hypothetical protein ACT4O0_08320 [Pseudonocardia sp.]
MISSPTRRSVCIAVHSAAGSAELIEDASSRHSRLRAASTPVIGAQSQVPALLLLMASLHGFGLGWCLAARWRRYGPVHDGDPRYLRPVVAAQDAGHRGAAAVAAAGARGDRRARRAVTAPGALDGQGGVA